MADPGGLLPPKAGRRPCGKYWSANPAPSRDYPIKSFLRAVGMIPKRPRLSPRKEEAIRSVYFEAFLKDRPALQDPVLGACCYPIIWSTVYNRSTNPLDCVPILRYQDRWTWCPSAVFMDDGRVNVVFRNVQRSGKVRLQYLTEVYKGEDVDVFGEFMAANDMPCAEHNPTGDRMFLPGQFTEFLKIAQQPEGNIYFAGEHLSRHHTWIAGAIDSGRATANAVFKDLQPAKAPPRLFNGWIPQVGGAPDEDYYPEMKRKEFICKALENIAKDRQRFQKAILLRLSGQF